MPISPRPPRGTKTSSSFPAFMGTSLSATLTAFARLNAHFLSPGRVRAYGPRRKENVARLDRYLARRLLENKPSGRIDRLKRAFDRLRGPRHADPCAKTGGE